MDRAALGLVGWLLLSLAALWVTGRLQPFETADTPGYLAATDWDGPRLPIYGWCVRQVAPTPAAYGRVPFLHAALLLLGALFLYGAVRRAGGSRTVALALTLPIPASNLAFRWTGALHPEVPAAAGLLFALGLALWAGGEKRRPWLYPLFGAALGWAYLLRPIHLAAVVFVPEAALWLYPPGRRRRAWALLLWGVLPLLVVSAYRYFRFGDPAPVAFGGFQAAGVATQLLRQETLPKLPAAVKPLGERILAARRRAEAAGRVLPVPRNSRGERNYVSVALQYFDVFARNYNYLLTEVVRRERQPGESWRDFEQRLRRFSLAVFFAEPLRYAAWVVGAITRAAGKCTVTNGAFLAALLVFLLALARRLGAPPGNRVAATFWELRLLLTLTAAYTLTAGFLMVTVSAPDPRYLDTAGLFLPALPLFAALALWKRNLAPTPAEQVECETEKRVHGYPD